MNPLDSNVVVAFSHDMCRGWSLVSSTHIPSDHVNTALTRRWSDLDSTAFMQYAGVASLAYSLALHPLFFLITRQQASVVAKSPSVLHITKEVYHAEGVRGFYRGCPISVIGTVTTDVIYYVLIESLKEFIPVEAKPVRDFSASVCSDALVEPLYCPFGVLSERQMMAPRCTKGLVDTADALVSSEGYRALFRGVFLSLCALPVSALWWILYEDLKGHAYAALQSRKFCKIIFPTVTDSDTSWIRKNLLSSTDNIFVNGSVGCVSSVAVTVLLNPLNVIRTRLQVTSFSKVEMNAKGRLLWITKDVYKNFGVTGFFKGFSINVLLGGIGGTCFGIIYEGLKVASDLKNNSLR